MRIVRDTSFDLFFAGRETLSTSYWLVVFTSVETQLNNYCVTSNSGASQGPILLPITEVGDGTATATSGQVKLSPPGDWIVKVYEQGSSTNLDPDNATRLVFEQQVTVLGDVCETEANSGTECPPGNGDCDPVTLTYEQPNGNAAALATVDAGGSYEHSRIAVTCNGAVVLHFWTSILGGSFKTGDPVQLPGVVYDNGGPDEAPGLVLPGNRVLYVNQAGTTGQKLTLNVPEYQGAADHFFDHEAGGAEFPRIVVTHADDSVYKTSDIARLVSGDAVADLKLSGVGIYTTDGLTLLTSRKDGQDYDLLPVRINYVNAAGDDTELGLFGVTGIAGPGMEIDKLFERSRLFDSQGVLIKFFSIADIESGSLVAPDGTVNIANSDDSYTDSQDVVSNGSADFETPDITVTEPDGGTSSYPSVKDLDIRDYKSGIAYRFGYPFWTGESTSYGTGSEGNLLATSWFEFTTPPYPETLATIDPGAGNPFITLAANNSFGNTNRFTDELGGQTYTNNLVVDHLTGLMWYRVVQTAAQWATMLTNAAAASFGGYSDWKVPPEKVMEGLLNYQLGANNLNYAPFSVSADLWTSTTAPNNNTLARRFITLNGNTGSVAKTTSLGYILCRKHLV